MGVTGLWRLIEPAGKPVPVETLENKVLAVDVSIWLHQMVKGYQDAKGAPLPNAHLMGLFQRLCKLLYFRIKPVFVFDGGFPELKKETIAKRQDHKAKYNSESERIKRELAILLSKRTAVNSLLGKQISPKKSNNNPNNNDDDIFKLPELPQREDESESESEDETSSGSIVDLHSVDIESQSFKNMPSKEKYDLLIELKETRKLNSWGKLHELPKKSDSFSDFQMQRLLKRRKVQECLEETEKEMGDSGMSIMELESLLNEEGIDTKIDTIPTRRIASNDSTRFLLIKDVKQALADAQKRFEKQNKPGPSTIQEEQVTEKEELKVDELEDDLQKAIKMSLECVDDDNVKASTSKTDDSWTSCMTDSDDVYSYDSEEEDGFEQPDNMSTAKAYIMQYSDFTHKAIDNMIPNKKVDKNKQKIPRVNQILDELSKEKSIIVDNVELSSDDDGIEGQSTCSPEISQKSIEPNTSEHSESPVKNILDASQCSVVCIENTQNTIISLDSSTEESNEITFSPKSNIKQKSDSSDEENEEIIETKSITPTTLKTTNQSPEVISNIKSDSDSSENEFEEVIEIENKFITPVVQLTLNMGKAVDDDIFADIFEDNKKENSEKVVPVTNPKTPDTVENKTITQINEIILANVNQQNFKSSEVKTSLAIEDPPIDSSNKSEKPIMKTVENKSNDINIDIDPPKHDTCNDAEHDTGNSHGQPNTKDDKVNKRQLEDQTRETVNQPKAILNTEKLTSLVEEIQNEKQDLLQEKGRLDRVGRNITEQMTKEAQELLQIFGIPYIVAPMEAEAQCAFLESVKLTDGTITDDSDIWLFGGRTVYKNFFNQKKHVLQFLADRIEKSFNLNREQLVLLALLVGSDYTTGLSGVGPVTALEILASFPFSKRQILNETTKQAKYAKIVKGLQEFKQWVRAGKRTDNTSLKKKLKNVSLTDDFPSIRVVQAYLEPNVENSEEKFAWGELDVTILRNYTKTKFGWSQNKLDEIIKPVLKRMLDRKTQRTVHDFFKRKVDFQSLEDQMRKRVKAAVQKMGPETPLEANAPNEEANKPARKRKVTKGKNKPNIEAGPSVKQRRENETSVLDDHGVKIVTQIKDGKSELEIKIPKSDRYQEIIPQRERYKQTLLQNKMKAIEVFRKLNIDKKRKNFKRKVLQPKDKAELSESDSD